MAGELSLKTPATGLVTLSPANTATDKTITLPATTGTVVIQDGTNTTTVTNLSAASITDSGNLTFTGTGNRILGDFSALTLTNRAAFQTSTTNDSTFIQSLPNGTGPSSGFFAYNNSNPTNAGVASLSVNLSNVQLASGISGTGTYIPLAFLAGGSERMRITTTGRLGIGTGFPGSKLDVDGGSSTGGFTVGGSIASVRASSMVIDMGDSNRIMALGPNTTTPGTLKFIVASSDASVYRTAATIDSEGNLGLGVTPGSWGAGWRTFEIGYAGNALFSNTNDSVGITANARLTPSGWQYATSGRAHFSYAAPDGSFQWHIAPSGTAGNAISFTQAMTLTGGNVTELRLLSSGSLATGSASIVRFGGTNNNVSGYVGYGGNANGYDVWNALAGSMAFGTSNLTRMTIDASGLIGVNTSTIGDSRIAARSDTAGMFAGTFVNYSAGGYGISIGSDSAYLAYFYGSGSRIGSPVGSITHNGTNTTYGTSSDYRLKENVQPMTGALAKVAQLKPCTFTWKSSGKTDEGFIAHELQAVCPSAVAGEKDAVNEDGSIKPQNVDTSFLVATLTAAIQELTARLEVLENK